MPADKRYKTGLVGFSFGFADFITLREFMNRLFTKALTMAGPMWGQTMNPAFMIHYHKGLSTNLDFMLLTWDHLLPSYLINFLIPLQLSFTQSTWALNLKCLLIKLYLTHTLFLVKCHNYKSTFGAQLPWGVGFQFNINDELYLISEAQYKTRLTDGFTDHLFYSFGFSVPLTAKQKPCHRHRRRHLHRWLLR